MANNKTLFRHNSCKITKMTDNHSNMIFSCPIVNKIERNSFLSGKQGMGTTVQIILHKVDLPPDNG